MADSTELKIPGRSVARPAEVVTMGDETETVPESFTADRHLTTSGGKRVKRWGSVKDACAILDECDPKTIHDLIHAKLVKGYKLNPRAKNSHFRVDLLSVWNHKQRQLGQV